jgi:hypothetical protein
MPPSTKFLASRRIFFEKAAPQKSSFQKIDFLVVGRRAGRTYPIAAQEESAISGYVPCQSPRPTLDVN